MSIVAILAIFFGTFFASMENSTAPEQAPVAHVQVQQMAETNPILAMDAAATLEDNGYAGFTDDKGRDYTITYVESSPSSDSKWNEFTLESIDFPGTFHHYKYDLLRTA